MRIFQGFDAVPSLRRPVVTVGSFDGVHAGHQALLGRLIAEARQRGGESVVVTFEPHSRIALGRAEGLHLLMTLDEKCRCLEALGVDNVVVAPFDEALRRLTGAEFIEQILLGKLHAELLVAGYNHRFGCDHLLAADYRGTLPVCRVDECRVEGKPVSSTVIRNLLAHGEAEEAARLLQTNPKENQ